MFENCIIGFIGGGNMAAALVGGLVRAGREPGSILVAEPDASRREDLAARHGVTVSADNADVAEHCETCVVAVKPQVMKAALAPLAPVLAQRRPLLLSIAAGIDLATLDALSGGCCPVVRTMPNTPALVGRGAAALVANDRVSPEERARAESILGAVGITAWLDDESLMDVVTALSGSGPAYFFLVMDALCRAAERHGLDAAVARRLCTQTALGAATLAMGSEESLERLRLNVTSPGGTTEQGVRALVDAGVESAFERAVDAAATRSRELSQPTGTN